MFTAAIWKQVKRYGLLVFWILISMNMYRSYLQEEYQTSYGYILPEQFSILLSISSIELALLYLILRPWSYRKSWLRSSLATLFFAPWTFLWVFLSQDGGPLLVFHMSWLAGVDLILFMSLLMSASSETVN